VKIKTQYTIVCIISMRKPREKKVIKRTKIIESNEKKKKIFRESALNRKIQSVYQYYPELEDPSFYEKIYSKKEFYQCRIQPTQYTSQESMCKTSAETSKKGFELLPQQQFLQHFLSPETPYNGILIYHGTGVGKTCSAISIVEQYKHILKKMKKKVIVLLHKQVREGFKKELFDLDKELKKKNPDTSVQCTGLEYSLGVKDRYISQDQKRRKIQSMIHQYYQFYGYDQFSNKVMKELKWDGKLESLTLVQKQMLDNMFSNSVFVIDEVHNISSHDKTFKKVPPVLQSIVSNAHNMKFILLSATPMFDSPKEIIFLLNLLLQNDGRPMMQQSDIFYPNGDIKPEGETILRTVARGYVSYIRSGNPLTNPYRIVPEDAKLPSFPYDMFGSPIEDNIQFTPLILCPMSKYQEECYYQVLRQTIETNKDEIKRMMSEENQRGGMNNNNNNNNMNNNNNTMNEQPIEEEEEGEKIAILQNITQISNIVYPTTTNEVSYGKYGFEESETGRGAFVSHTRKVIQGDKKRLYTYFTYQRHCLEHPDTKQEVPFLDASRVGTYSAKFKACLDTIMKSKGVVYIYSTYKDAGVYPFAMMLEQNGFSRYAVEGERDMLEYTPNRVGGGGKRPPICYQCGKPVSEDIHHNKKKKEYHEFSVAKYLMLSSGEDISKMTTAKAVDILSKPSNIYGKDVKIIIGTKVSGEGITFKNVRQVHILDPWYNFSRLEQTIGRAIRHCSHVALPPEERNVEVFLYAAVPHSKSQWNQVETIDIKNYRFSERKDRKIKRVRRILKEVSVDCSLFYPANVFPPSKHSVRQITSMDRVVQVRQGDVPFTADCDYEKNCDYSCAWMPKEKREKVDENTYHILYDKHAIDTFKKYIKKLYRVHKIYTLEDIVSTLSVREKENMYILYKALDVLLHDPKEYIYDVYRRPGKLVYRGIYYMFQPLHMKETILPMYYRNRPIKSKTTQIPLQTLITNDETNQMMMNMNRVFQWDEYIETIWMEWIDFYISWKEMEPSKEIPKHDIRILVDIIIDRIPYELYKSFLPWLFKKQWDIPKGKGKKGNDIRRRIPWSFFLERMRIFYVTPDFLKEQRYVDKEIEIKRSYPYIGYYDNIGNQVYIWNDKTKRWKQSTKELSNAMFFMLDGLFKKNQKSYHTLSNIYGYMEPSSKDLYRLFKIVDKSKERGAVTTEMKKSKRSEVTGRVCSTFYLGQLIDLFKELHIQVKQLKIKKVLYCFLLEWYLREYQESKKNNMSWFIHSIPK
jgi:Type III restriction enzyme, res subunit/Helicase conserved C-terminal domain